METNHDVPRQSAVVDTSVETSDERVNSAEERRTETPDPEDLAWLRTVAKRGYFCLYGGMGFLQPFWSVLLVNKGFSATMVGLITSVQPLASLLLLPALSLHADRKRNAPQIFKWAQALSSVFALVLCYAGDQTVAAIASIFLFIVMVPVFSFFDEHTMAFLPASKKTEWGNLRVWGAYGWGIAAPLSSYLFGNFGWTYSGIGFAMGSAGVSYYMHVSEAAVANRPPSEKKYKAVADFVRSHRKVRAFLLGAATMGMGYILIGTFLFIYLKEVLHAPEILLGISVSMTVAVEIPFMNYSAKLHANFTDAQLFTAAALGWSVRVVGYSLLTNPWYVLLLEPLHGFSFALLWLSSVHFFSDAFPQDLSSTAFGVLHASVFGFGPVFGNIIGGYLYDALGPRQMYRVASVLMLVMLVAFWYLLKTAPEDEESKKEDTTGKELQVVSREMLAEDTRHHECAAPLPAGIQ